MPKVENDLGYMMSIACGIVEKPAGAPESEFAIEKDKIIEIGPLVTEFPLEALLATMIARTIDAIGPNTEEGAERILRALRGILDSMTAVKVEADKDVPEDAATELIAEVDLDVRAPLS